MAGETPSLLTFYAGWGKFQNMLVKMIAPLSPEQLALPGGAHHWSIWQLVQHIAGNRVWWYQVWMGEGNPALAPIAHWDPQDTVEVAPLTAPELVAGLESSWQMIADALGCWTAADLPHVFLPPAIMSEEERGMFGNLSRQWIIWHVLEHEILHAGELSLALGSYGLPGIYGDV